MTIHLTSIPPCSLTKNSAVVRWGIEQNRTEHVLWSILHFHGEPRCSCQSAAYPPSHQSNKLRVSPSECHRLGEKVKEYLNVAFVVVVVGVLKSILFDYDDAGRWLAMDVGSEWMMVMDQEEDLHVIRFQFYFNKIKILSPPFLRPSPLPRHTI